MDLLLSALEMLARWDILIALVAGSLGGIIIGAIPGVGPAVAIAILLPATYAMEPLTGLTLLLGIYGSSMFGGALPAILLNTPGTAVNALTTYDGYPMTRRGEATRAISLAYGASFCGGVISVLALIALSPLLASIAPNFGAKEIFLAALLGMVLVVIVHRGQNMAAGALLCFGIFINTIGLEPIRYSKRFTFDQTWLASGIDVIVVVLGLFALSQAFVLLLGEDQDAAEPKIGRGVFQHLFEVLRFPKTVLSSSGFGVIFGIIPGVGEFLAQFFSYSLAQKTSKTPEEFGNGSPEGIIASEAANNAVPAAAMIPLLALGIPGEALTAMMLTVFYVHNVIPGPGLFEQRPEFILGLYLCLLALNVLALVFLILFSRQLTRVIIIPNRYLGMIILTLSFVGVYALRNSVTDCAIAAGFGVLGMVLKRLNLPIVPIILGMVLGGIMEVKLRIALANVQTPLDMINRPIAATIFGLIVLAVTLHLISVFRLRKALSNPV
ncbi:tripartite tricarboxylate transporter permease [Leisingera sp. McT4-56]|uniref:tripartite tricarboxylate transporter permease n=1 Tax=Leisingera sp. McT4-56 TaxID=2881255 RepID=UPI001CF84582|nr:tripartite tricarboxylate transporter permease [Leisingera sp. McT4-56]MCB4457998.1 tripartite tricarboxylate transporter permease [Leisingera sp. McT4-56]